MKLKSLFMSIIMFGLLFSSCGGDDMQRFNVEVIQGMVSAKEPSRYATRITFLPKIWVQSPKNTRCVEIPIEYENRWNVGDSVILIIEKYKVSNSEKNK